MQTQSNAVFTSVPLTNASLAYTNDMYIAEKVAPVVQVVKQAGKIYSYGMGNLRIVNSYRAVGGMPNVVETTVSSADHYALEDHVLGEFIPEEVLLNQESPINARLDVTEALTDRIWVDKEKALADVVTNTSNITQNTTLTGTDQWNDYANSDPIADMKTALAAVRAGSGKKPNTFIISWDVLNTLLFHPDIQGYFPGAPAITKEMLETSLPRIFGLPKMFVGEAQYNNSNLGGTDTLADIWTKDCLVAYVEDRPTLKSRTLANTYQRKASRRVELLPMGTGGLETVQRKSDYVQVSDEYDQVLVDEKCAYLIEAAIA
jgi:hypothetical protein